MFKKIMFLLALIIFEQRADALAVTYSFSPNTLISSSQVNQNFTDVETVVNALTATNLSADCVTAEKLNADVVRSGYGLVQHTDGSLYVDLSDTYPGLELTDGGLRAKVYGVLRRTSNGVEWGRSGDMLLSSNGTTPDGFTDVSNTYGNRFIRISPSGLATGGSDSHTHGGATGSHTLTTNEIPAHSHDVYYNASGGSQTCLTYNAPATRGNFATSSVGGGAGHTHTIATADNIPAYVSLYMYQKS
jgi:hypothetical protein